MSLWKRIKSTPFMIKLLHWEYWPFEVIYAIPFLYWVYLSARAGSFFFFRAANPAIPNGGMFGEF